jgi:hypothetical protein
MCNENNNTVWEAALLVFLMGVIYEVDNRDSMICILKFSKIGSGIQVILPQESECSSIGITDGNDL